MRFFGLIGKTLEHSFSPVFFKEKFEKENITDFTELSGLNVTIPYKKEIIPFLDELDENAERIGAVNTIKFEWINNKLKLIGFNTDYLGFIDSIKPHIRNNQESALVLGTGGSSLAVIYGLKKMGINYIQVSRNPKNSKILAYKDLSAKIISQNKIIINTTPLGMYPDISKYPELDYTAISNQHLLYDLIYNPKKTEFLGKGEAKGARILNGYEMLIAQAEYSWKIWNNIDF